jgi:hypothetical protein
MPWVLPTTIGFALWHGHQLLGDHGVGFIYRTLRAF